MSLTLKEKLGRERRYMKTMLRLLGRVRKAKPDKEVTVADQLEEVARQFPSNRALVLGDVSMTYRELDERANQIARWAQAQGVQRGESVALLMGNRPEYVAVWLGILKMGGTCALINHHLQGLPLAHTLRLSQAKHLVLGSESVEHWKTANGHLEQPLTVWEQDRAGAGPTLEGARGFDAALAEHGSQALPFGTRQGMLGSQVALYIYTSGTTGLPKAARMTHVRVLNFMHAFATMLDSNETDRIYVPLPLYHATGGVGGLGAALSVGGTAVLRDKFSASRFWSDIVEHDCTMFMYIGELCRYLVNSPEHPDERSHRIRACMGNGLRPDVWPKFRDRFKLPHVVEFYGSTEGNVATFNLDDRTGSIGRIPSYVQRILNVKIVKYDVENECIVRDAKGRCIECAPGEAGEAIGLIGELISATRFEGYTDPQATEKKILRDAFKKGDQWFRTGDLLSRDEEGYFYFVDRIGDTFRWKGENVATSEVAEVLGVFQGIAEANVYGVQIPGADGRAGMASIVAEGALDFGKLFEHVDKQLASYAQPIFLRLQGAMDVTGTMKHRKADLVKEGFNPAVVPEPLYVRDASSRSYVPLTADLYAQVQSGALRL